MNSITKKAHAKINLGLRILNKRPDNFHNIESIFLYINWFDEILFTFADHFSFSCSDNSLPTDESNLVVKVVRQVEQIMGTFFPYHVHLQKNIPYGAGLGGGSSDAATVLTFAVEQKMISFQNAINISTALGSDITFFLNPMTQIGTDRGINLDPIDFYIPYYILTVFPKIEVSTKLAYSLISPQKSNELIFRNLLVNKINIADYQTLFVNDFDHPISEHFPDIKLIKYALREFGADYVSLSGSGGACFGIFEDKKKAEQARENLLLNFPVNLTPPNFKV